uniref:Ovule protein n=1 Tax=Romanomermis culicivorax TaxID=13658 RepID=A0A915IVJ0_ROMCU
MIITYWSTFLYSPIHEMLTFKSSASQHSKEKWTLPYVAKQLISREIEIRKNKTKHREENTTLQI